MEEGTEIQVCSDFPMSKDYLCLPGTRGTRRRWEPPPALALWRAPRCEGHCQSLLVFWTLCSRQWLQLGHSCCLLSTSSTESDWHPVIWDTKKSGESGGLPRKTGFLSLLLKAPRVTTAPTWSLPYLANRCSSMFSLPATQDSSLREAFSPTTALLAYSLRFHPCWVIALICLFMVRFVSFKWE